MTTHLPRARLKTKDGKTKVEMPKPRLAAGQRRNMEGKAKREESAWQKKGRRK